MRANQVSQVRGFADQRLRYPKQPFAPSNRRISLIVQYQGTDGSDASIPDAVTKMNADKSGDSAPTVTPDPGTAKPDQSKEGAKNAAPAPAAKANAAAPAGKSSPLKALGHLFHK
jgi:chemotaxis protein MotB